MQSFANMVYQALDSCIDFPIHSVLCDLERRRHSFTKNGSLHLPLNDYYFEFKVKLNLLV